MCMILTSPLTPYPAFNTFRVSINILSGLADFASSREGGSKGGSSFSSHSQSLSGGGGGGGGGGSSMSMSSGGGMGMSSGGGMSMSSGGGMSSGGSMSMSSGGMSMSGGMSGGGGGGEMTTSTSESSSSRGAGGGDSEGTNHQHLTNCHNSVIWGILNKYHPSNTGCWTNVSYNWVNVSCGMCSASVVLTLIQHLAQLFVFTE